MSRMTLAIRKTGLVTSVGLSAPAACAAMRAKITNPSETRFIDSTGQWIMAHQVPLEQPWRGIAKLARMAAMAIDEALADVPRVEWPRIPLLLCVAERDRPGRLPSLDDQLFGKIEEELGVRFHADSAVVPQGRVGVAVGLAQARQLLARSGISQVLVAATDSLLNWPTLSHYEQQLRLLTETNSNGFMPGEGAGALLVALAEHDAQGLLVGGIGFGREAAHIDSEAPLRADGLSTAIKAALADTGLEMHDMSFRITDVSGEQYYFKEAALALSRTLRQRKTAFDIWHPAECTGEAGALAGASIVAVADMACRKSYANGPAILAHMANDSGPRAAMTLHYRGA
jgi:3-oxoacyl-[acyl-carrier-protein] synthase-1